MAIELLNEIKSTASFTSTGSAKAVVAVEKIEATDSVKEQALNTSKSVPVNNYQNENNRTYNADKQDKSLQDKQTSDTSKKSSSKEINKLINKNTVAEFGYHEGTNRITIKIKDKNTNEIIKEIPSEKALEMLEKAWEIAGILVDEKR